MTVHWLVAGGSISACCRPLLGARCQVMLRGQVEVITLVLVSTTLLTSHTLSSLQSPVYLL